MHVRLKFLWVSDNEEEGGLGVPLKKRWVGLFVRDVECGRLSSPVLNKQEKKKKNNWFEHFNRFDRFTRRLNWTLGFYPFLVNFTNCLIHDARYIYSPDPPISWCFLPINTRAIMVIAFLTNYITPHHTASLLLGFVNEVIMGREAHLRGQNTFWFVVHLSAFAKDTRVIKVFPTAFF